MAPGLIDIHINGCYGIDFATASVEALLEAASRLGRIGVAGFLPTVTSRPRVETLAALARIEAARRLQREGATILGAHLEGPMISRRRAGVHTHFRALTKSEWSRARMITVAPEVPGALAVIRAAARAGVLVAIGHTDADAATARRAADAGARVVGHLFNAMRPLHHRDESVLNAALTDERLTCELIYDGEHVAASAAKIALACKGPDGIVLVSDAVAGSNRKRGRLAGSRLLLPDVVRRAERDLDPAARRMATRVPAGLLGLL